MACSCQNKRNSFEVVQDAGRARSVFTSSSLGTAEAAADRYPASVVRDKKDGTAVYFAWPKGPYEVVHQTEEVVTVLVASRQVRNEADRKTLREAADGRPGAVVRAVNGGTVVYPLPAALTASGATLKAADTSAATPANA